MSDATLNAELNCLPYKPWIMNLTIKVRANLNFCTNGLS